MYPQSPSSPNKPGLTRYGSAPGAFMNRAVDSVIGSEREFSNSFVQYFSGDSSSLTSESTCKVNSSNDPKAGTSDGAVNGGLQRSYGFNDIDGGSLTRQRSSPAGFLSHLASENNAGFTMTRGYSAHNGSTSTHTPSRLKSQLSFTRQDSLSQISEVSESAAAAVAEGGISSDRGCQNSTPSYPSASFGIEPWQNSKNIVFSSSSPTSKRLKTLDGDIFNCFNALETQYSMPQTSLEMAAVEKLLNIPEDSVPCKIRAKRGCATHPRSIAERERRTRISGKLKKLQELVPNMDKQTSYADMLDLAVQHIKGLQTEVQKLHHELENCTCGCKPDT